ncbi:MAG: hypothetical protein US71_C0001G0082 [Parcubacteria group bacterium GW2011_GWD2_38_12]|nr:MAG: hypothetical protein US06_C0013G0007 [Parcubacteria group bacterium GW2011_GWC2_36_17]KKQ43481.1 MAG: hypothetical protein US61_C0010G0013 [Parcubacteria group bacterium GW2011_GWE2_37_8]KKQ52879.1 MAG: hypothetical protein US71_C0001G0082 [Parcubacteria group bacterium GW2011_GWD2_38_12]KKQ59082.1 MAG: hypothetical protein US79_C0001G0081 [Parcubacteria group bacterium GW2011_GWC1_38_17]KKQ59697.1 MAG: hypothetical protein US78_C0001G0057 [Parcubacteria group bacterium GW2011_GWD1_38_1
MFICLEGIAGSGKTTQTKLLADYLKNVKGKDIFISAVYEGERRSVVSDFMNASGIKLDQNAVMFLFQALHAAQYHEVKNALSINKTVIADRWRYSFFAHHVYQDTFGKNENLMFQLDLLAYRSLEPDICFLIDIPAKIAYNRYIERERSINDNGLDLRMEMLKNIENQFKQDHLNFYGIQASAKDLPITDESVDFVHQRFVLMHLSPEDQKRDIKEVLRVAKDKVFLLEYDWETLSSRENEDILKEFRDLSFQLMGKSKIDPFMGAKLEMLLGEVGQGLDTDIKKFSREESDYTDELIDLCVISNKMATSILKDEDLASKFSALRDKLSNSHIKFTPPSIVAVTVRK